MPRDAAPLQVAGMRDKLVHDYDQVNLSRVWAVVTRNLPDLLRQVEALLAATGHAGQ